MHPSSVLCSHVSSGYDFIGFEDVCDSWVHLSISVWFGPTAEPSYTCKKSCPRFWSILTFLPFQSIFSEIVNFFYIEITKEHGSFWYFVS